MKKEDIRVDDEVYFVFNDFDGSGCQRCIVTEINEDHIMVHDKELDINYWIDDEDINHLLSSLPVLFA